MRFSLLGFWRESVSIAGRCTYFEYQSYLHLMTARIESEMYFSMLVVGIPLWSEKIWDVIILIRQLIKKRSMSPAANGLNELEWADNELQE